MAVETNGEQMLDKTAFQEQSPQQDIQAIAIIGMACRLPGDVSNPEQLWELCLNARNTWSEVPADRFSQATFYHPNPDKRNCLYNRGGHFLSDDLSRFDAQFFNITAQEAKSLDPQQRLMLECTYEALENAGISLNEVVGRNVGVFIGGSSSDYDDLILKDVETMPIYEVTGNDAAILSGRLSYFFGLRGPSLTVDTACSSSLTAIHLACQSLLTGQSQQAIVGGSHLNLIPDMLISKSNIRLLSPEGKSFAFDHRSDGYGPGEGTGCLILKPLGNALRDGDSVRAVIRGSGINQDGRTQGMTMPSGEAQEALARATYDFMSLDPQQTDYVEAHGTGTATGDPIEADIIDKVFGKGRSPERPLYIGSVKSNIGHLEGASGVVSVIKTAMMLEKGIILPNANFDMANPAIRSLRENLRVANGSLPWPATDIRRASVSNFGYGGSNAHIIMEEPPNQGKQRFGGSSLGGRDIEDSTAPNRSFTEKVTPSHAPLNPPRMFVLAANDRFSLCLHSSRLKSYLESKLGIHEPSFMRDLAYTLGERRSMLPWKIAFAADTATSLIGQLEKPDQAMLRSTKAPNVGFVFTGQGAQWYGMGRELLASHSIFSSTIDSATESLYKLGASYSLRQELLKDGDTSRLGEASLSQPACTAIQIALVLLLRSWGVRPVAVTGHSSGEIAAAFAADVLTIDACMSIAYHRGQAAASLRKSHPNMEGAMLAMGVGQDTAKSMIMELALTDRVVIACINSPSSVTFSGDKLAIEQLQQAARNRRFLNKRVQVDIAYHSHHMKPVSEVYRHAMGPIKPAMGKTVRLVSSLTGVPINTLVLGTSYWVSNLVSPVQFLPAMRYISEQCDLDLLIEIGSHTALQGPIREILDSSEPGSRIKYLPSLVRNMDCTQSAMKLASNLLINGCTLDASAVNPSDSQDEKPNLINDLPCYPWNHEQRYWHESRLGNAHLFRKFPRSDVLGVLAIDSNDLEPRWRNVIELDNIPWLRDHKVQSDVLCPMTFFIAMVLEAANQRAALKGVSFTKFVLREMSVGQALILPESTQTETLLALRALAENTRASSDIWDEFIIHSWTVERGWLEHCRGQISVQSNFTPNTVTEKAHQDVESTMIKEELSQIAMKPLEEVNIQQIYETFAWKGLEFGPAFRNLVECRFHDGSAAGRVLVPRTKDRMPEDFETETIIHPGLLDSCFQISWPIITEGLKVLLRGTPVASRVKQITVDKDIGRYSEEHLDVYASGASKSLIESYIRSVVAVRPGELGGSTLIHIEGYTSTTLQMATETEVKAMRRCWTINWEPCFDNPIRKQTGTPQELTADDELVEGINRGTTETRVTHLNGDALVEKLEHIHGATVIQDASTLTSRINEKVIVISTTRSKRVSLDAIVTGIETMSAEYPIVVSLAQAVAYDLSECICLFLDEIETGILAKITSEEFDVVKKLCSAKGLMWVVQGASTAKSDPNSNLVYGLLRTIRNENAGIFTVILDLDEIHPLPAGDASNLVCKVFARTWANQPGNKLLEREYMERDGCIYVPRILEDMESSRYVQQETNNVNLEMQPFEQPNRPLRLTIDSPGFLDTLYHEDHELMKTPLGSSQVELHIHATGVNFRDVMYAVGQISSENFGGECSGVITAIGSDVSNVKVGDRVCALSDGGYSNFTRCSSYLVARIPPDVSSVSAAAIPVIFCTAYYALVEAGRLVRGESILIHAAAGGVGQAAIRLAQWIGSDIYATVGSAEKKRFLIYTFGIVEDHIFNSRDTSFAECIKYTTKGRGVDVVLNSLAGEALIASLNCLAPFGRFLEIGKKDLMVNTRVELEKFTANATYATVDLLLLQARKPELTGDILAKVTDLIFRGAVSNIPSILVYPISQIEQAFRFMQSGKSVGKIVVEPREGDQVKARIADFPAVLPKLSHTILRRDASYLITGGTGGLGQAITRWLVKQGAMNIILVSRSGYARVEVAELVRESLTFGAHVVVMRCDISNKSEVARMAEECSQFMPPIKGVIHGSAVFHNVLFEESSYKEYMEVIKPKVDGAWNLHYVFQDLTFFVMLGSVASVVGNHGQAAYGATSTFLDAFARYRVAQGLPAATISLGAVEGAGYFAEDTATRTKHVNRHLGIQWLNQEDVCALIAASIRTQVTGSIERKEKQWVTGLGILPGFAEPFWLSDSKFHHLRESHRASLDATMSEGQQGSLNQKLKTAQSFFDARKLIYDSLAGKIADVLMMPAEDVNPSLPMATYGLDSLVAVEIRNWIARELDVKVSMFDLISGSTLELLAATIVKKSKFVCQAAKSEDVD